MDQVELSKEDRNLLAQVTGRSSQAEE
jgi:hypothetical protein